MSTDTKNENSQLMSKHKKLPYRSTESLEMMNSGNKSLVETFLTMNSLTTNGKTKMRLERSDVEKVLGSRVSKETMDDIHAPNHP